MKRGWKKMMSSEFVDDSVGKVIDCVYMLNGSIALISL